MRPIRSPTLLPIKMNAAETNASRAIAACTQLTVVSEIVDHSRDRHIHQRRVDHEHEARHRQQQPEPGALCSDCRSICRTLGARHRAIINGSRTDACAKRRFSSKAIDPASRRVAWPASPTGSDFRGQEGDERDEGVSSEPDRPTMRFEPLRPASRGRLIAGFMLGPLLWLVALLVAAWLFDYSWAIALGLLVTVVSVPRLADRPRDPAAGRAAFARRGGMWTAAERAAGVRRAVPGMHRGAVDRGWTAVPRARRAEPVEEPEGGWPGVSVLIPAYNEESVIATCVGAALAADYPELEVLVLDDGSTDGTEAAARAAAGGDPRCRVIRDPVNRGKADRLNVGLREARYELVAVTDADTHLHPYALKLLVARMRRSPIVAAVAGAPHVTNRGALPARDAGAGGGRDHRPDPPHPVPDRTGRRRRRRARAVPPRSVLAVGGYDPRMATEDIDLTWKLLLAGWQTAYEPHALVGMQVPSTLRAVGAAQALGPRPRRSAARPLPRGQPLAQPSHVAARPRVARVAALDRRARRCRSSSPRSASCSAGRGPVRFRVRVGDRDRRDRAHSS